MRSLLLRIVAIIVSTTLASCGSLLGGNYACDLRPGEPQCTDWRNLIGVSTSQEVLCKTLIMSGGNWKPNEKCAASGSVGGCQTDTSVGLQTNWFYAPRTEADVRAECTRDGTTFVSP